MPRQHAGAPRRFARDFVDSPTTISEFLLPAAIVSMIALVFFAGFTRRSSLGSERDCC